MHRFSIKRMISTLSRFRSDQSGAVAMVTAVGLPVLIGFAALTVDVTLWSSSKTSAQGAADAAAMSAVKAAAAGNSVSQSKNEATAIAAADGFTNGVGGATVTVNNPPASGAYTSNSGAYEVIITKPQTLYFAGIFGAAPQVTGRSVAASNSPPACVLALEPSAQQAINMSGSAALTTNNCSVVANSTNAGAVKLSGSACLKPSQLTLVGNYSSSSSCAVTGTVKTNAAATADPYASVTVPSYSGCTQNNYQLSGGSATISAGVYCGGISVSGSSQLTLNAGTYIIDSGDLSVSGSASLIATAGVTLILTSKTNHYGKVAFSGGTTVSVTAPSTGTYAGMAIITDRNAAAQNNDFSGGSTQSIIGAIYMPSQNVDYSGQSNAANTCTQLVVLKLNLSGSAGFGRNCGTVPVAGLSGSSLGIVE